MQMRFNYLVMKRQKNFQHSTLKVFLFPLSIVEFALRDLIETCEANKAKEGEEGFYKLKNGLKGN